MSVVTQTQIRRGTAAQIAIATGATGEIWYGLDNFHLYTNDGVTKGGHLVALFTDIPTNFVTSGQLQQTGSILYNDIIGVSGALNTSITNTNNNLTSTGSTLLALISNTSVANVVYLTGAQNITGQKTFSGVNFFVWGSKSNTIPVLYSDSNNNFRISNGTNVTFNATGYLIDNSNVTGLNWSNRTLYDAFGTASIAWSSRGLADGFQVLCLDYGNRILYQNIANTTFNPVLNWQNAYMTGTQWAIQSGLITESLKLTPAIQPTGKVFLGNNPYYIYTGNTSGIFVLPTISSCTGRFYFVKNRGQNGFLSGQGSDRLFSYASVLSAPFNSGDAYIISNDGIYWNVM